MKHPEIEVRPRDRREGRGLDATDRAYLGILADAGQPFGLGTVAAVLGEEEANVSEVVESYLLRAGLIVKGLGVGHSSRPGGSTTSLEASETQGRHRDAPNAFPQLIAYPPGLSGVRAVCDP